MAEEEEIKDVVSIREQLKMMLYYIVRLPWMLWDRRK
jgi:hypothetical protein